ncbi:MAG: RraA family protein [Candidatus Limnocylindrales bacterium]|jgi:regulator of RNase E activity RraA
MADRMDEICAALREWDSPSLSNAIERLNLRPRDTGFTDPSIRNVVPAGRIAGVAVTVRTRARKAGDKGIDKNLLYEAIAAANGPAILVAEDDDDPPGLGALVGEVTGTHLLALGCVGVVTNGCVRDVDELEEMGLSVHALGPCVSHGYIRVTAVGVPVTVGGLRVEPGDLLHADKHGVLSIPREGAPKLPAIAEQIRIEETETITWVRSPAFSIGALLKR